MDELNPRLGGVSFFRPRSARAYDYTDSIVPVGATAIAALNRNQRKATGATLPAILWRRRGGWRGRSGAGKVECANRMKSARSERGPGEAGSRDQSWWWSRGDRVERSLITDAIEPPRAAFLFSAGDDPGFKRAEGGADVDLQKGGDLVRDG